MSIMSQEAQLKQRKRMLKSLPKKLFLRKGKNLRLEMKRFKRFISRKKKKLRMWRWPLRPSSKLAKNLSLKK